MAPIKRTPVVGETLTAVIRSAGRTEQYLCTVLEVSPAVCRVKLFNGATLRVHVVQLFV